MGWMFKLIKRRDDGVMYADLLCYLPLDHGWARSQVTMLGDAAHLMLSLAAVAANLARVDVFELGVVLADTVHEGMRVEDPEREAAIAA